MRQQLEQEIILPDVTVQLATISWEGVGERPPYPHYSLFQRLSGDHSPLRIGDLSTPQMLPRVRSVGLLPPDCSIRLLPIEKPMRVLYCFYDAEYVEETTGIARSRWEKQAAALRSIRNQRLETLMQEIQAELEQPGLAQEVLVESVTRLMLVELARHLTELERKNSRQSSSLPLAPWQLQRIEERIQAAPALGYPGPGELAELCGVSQGHLARSFKAATGWQLRRYIAVQRISAAKQLLADERLSCEEVAARLGFKSPGYFSTAFRRHTGKTPMEFRKQALAREAVAGRH